MKKFITSLSHITVITLLLFLLINLIIAFSWKYFNTKNALTKNPFPTYIQEIIELNDADQKILFRDTHNMKYHFKAFVGPILKNVESKFINYDTEKGRATSNPKNCKKKIFMFGGSTTFGWLSTDDQTIASHLSNILSKNSMQYCVYNYGSPTHYSKQENNFFINLIENNNIPDYAIFLDGINEACTGYVYEKNIEIMFEEINASHRSHLVLKKIPGFIKSMPFIQLYDRLVLKKTVDFIDAEEMFNCPDKQRKSNFESRLKLRQKICEINFVKCKSFLQPFGGMHGNVYPGSTTYLKSMQIRYNLFKEIDNSLIKDISSALDEDTNKFSYVDNLHYSHNANFLIASKIFNTTFENNEQ